MTLTMTVIMSYDNQTTWATEQDAYPRHTRIGRQNLVQILLQSERQSREHPCLAPQWPNIQFGSTKATTCTISECNIQTFKPHISANNNSNGATTAHPLPTVSHLFIRSVGLQWASGVNMAWNGNTRLCAVPSIVIYNLSLWLIA